MCTLRLMPASVCIKALELKGGAGLWKNSRKVTARTRHFSTGGLAVSYTGLMQQIRRESSPYK